MTTAFHNTDWARRDFYIKRLNEITEPMALQRLQLPPIAEIMVLETGLSISDQILIRPFWGPTGFYEKNQEPRALIKVRLENDQRKIIDILTESKIPCEAENGNAENRYFGVCVAARNFHKITTQVADNAHYLISCENRIEGLNETARIGHLSGTDPKHSFPHWTKVQTYFLGSDPYIFLRAYNDSALATYSKNMWLADIPHHTQNTRNGMAILTLSQDVFHRLDDEKIQQVKDFYQKKPQAVLTAAETRPYPIQYGWNQLET